jgi:hypothetical protein
MVNANRTITLRNAAKRAPDLTPDEDKISKVTLRRDEVRHAPAERFGAGGCAERRAEPPRRSPGASGGVGEYIGRELRGLYDDVVAQPVPDRFLSLLNKLESGAISAEGAGVRGERD